MKNNEDLLKMIEGFLEAGREQTGKLLELELPRSNKTQSSIDYYRGWIGALLTLRIELLTRED